jgi:hypothetical protein
MSLRRDQLTPVNKAVNEKEQLRHAARAETFGMARRQCTGLRNRRKTGSNPAQGKM